MTRPPFVLGVAMFTSLACAGVPKKTVDDAATNIAGLAQAGKAANQLCITSHTNCDQVPAAFDGIGVVAASLHLAATNAK